MEILECITLDAIRQARPEMIYYGAQTCWWTHDPAHLCTHPQSGLPCDPRAGMLFQTDDVEGFLWKAQQNAEAGGYGKHGMRAFMAAHHQNCVVSLTDQRSTCGTTWEEYNDALDRLIYAEEHKE